MIYTDVVDTSLHFLLSKDAMKMVETEIVFSDDKVKMFARVQVVILTKLGSSLYAPSE